MLYSLHVKDLALIKEQEIEFGEGLNVLTGETGAGKSVLIGSVNLALGSKADKDLIRTGADYALVELTFFVDNDITKSRIKEMDLPIEEDGTVILSRKIMDGRSICKVGGENVTVRQLRLLGELLINIHGQNDNQTLLQNKKHLEILDSFAGDKLLEHKKKLKEVWSLHENIKAKLEETDIDEATRKREQDLAMFELEEIQGADLKEGEDEELEARYRRMANSLKITEAAGEARQLLFGEEGESASDAISGALQRLITVSAYDESVKELTDQLGDIDNLMTDLGHSLSAYLSDLEFDDEEFKNTEDRLDLINHLKDKYGNSIGDILKYADEKQDQLDILSNLEEERARLQKELGDCLEEAKKICAKISDIRKKNAKVLAEQMKQALIDLNFLDVQFRIDVIPDEDHITSSGYDEAVFMISTNPGEQLRPLSEIASGGELSRIMLALKTVFADQDDIASLIFDEIDTGISGVTAWKVSEKLGKLAASHQIICITHLPQIAAMYDRHFLIQKGLSDSRTITSISRLSDDESIDELGRMLGAGEVTDAVRQNAREMRNKALKTKA
ncbi:DNA repair protein RecN [Butyrivibrio fibrisolvens]|uniref:DNA repair protein RecN n=1 Tax=Butyrivibrio fibrisolvens TaxID=831 RepID=UPI0003B76CC1|nr:DNA repair protein RecN [Butyrivibrio fibrisolvens]